jgi:signal transduction histidine kinase
METAFIHNKGLYQIEITDTGTGILSEILPKLFEKFASKSGREHPTGKGTGLGLFITKTIIQAHGGDIIGSNNENGPGARFLIRLPVDGYLNANAEVA